MNKEQVDYRAPNRILSLCLITVYRDMPLGIATETSEGMSVTHAAEVIGCNARFGPKVR